MYKRQITLRAGPGSSIGLAETLALLAALLVVGLAELSSLASQWRGRRVPGLQGLRGRYITSLAVASIGVVAAGLLIPPLTSTDISGSLFHGSGRGLGGSAAGDLATVGFNPVVQPGGDLVNRPIPVLTYSTDQGSQTYLQVVDDTVFNAGNWIPQFDSAVGQTKMCIRDSVATVLGDVAPVAGTPAATEPPPSGYECVGDSCPSGPVTNPTFLDVDEVSLRSGTIDSLETSGSVSTATVAELENAGTDYPSWVLSLSLIHI